MKKFIVLSALAAVASTAFVACSSDDDLVSQSKGTEITDTKCPFNFVVGMDNGTYTRGTSSEVASDMIVEEDMDVTRAVTVSDPFSADKAGLELWGFEAGKGMFSSGSKQFEYDKDKDEWSLGDWTGITGKCFFYALSYAGKKTTTIDPGNTMAAEDKPILSSPTGESYNQVSFNYILPSDDNGNLLIYYDDEAGTEMAQHQEDLLVAYNWGEKEADPSTNYKGLGYGDDVALSFSHALANLEIKMALPVEGYIPNTVGGYYDPHATGNRFSYAQFYYINSITIHNLPAKGTYKFGSGWSGQENLKSIKIIYPNGKIIPAISYDAKATIVAAAESKTKEEIVNPFKEDATARRAFERQWYEDILTDGTSVMLIPHEVPSARVWSDGAVTNSMTYIEINGFIGTYTDTSDATEMDATEIATLKSKLALCKSDGNWTGSKASEYDFDVHTGDIDGESFCIKIPAQTFSANKKYTFYITVTMDNLYQTDGNLAADPT